MDKKSKLTLAGFCLLASLAGAALFVTRCDTNERCDFVDVRDFPSPDGHNLVTAFGFDCHNTTGYDTHLQLRSPGAKLQVPGNIFTIDFGGEFTVRWHSPSNVIVGLSEPTPDPTNIAGITVTFAKLPPTN
jgi:hypothetical protein